MLYKNEEFFKKLIISASNELRISETILEKDYFLMGILYNLNKKIPGLLFKGGTCCSHAYHVLDRFSEDIDLTLDINHFGRNKNTSANHMIIKVCESLGFRILNINDVKKHSHGNYNCYYIEYPSLFKSSSLIKPFIQIDMSFYQKSFPSEIKQVNSIIGEWLLKNKQSMTFSKFQVLPFNICVQKLERTFIDKGFAICDYYENNEVVRNSRHIYDIYKISHNIDINSKNMKNLIKLVRNERSKNKKCISAKDGYDINLTLSKIIQSNFFKNDHNNITMQLLINVVNYHESIKILDKIIKLNIFN